MTPLERDIEKALVAMVKRRGGLCLKWTCPGWSGVPDRIILLPHGHIIFAELKRPKGGKVAPLQQWWRDKLNELGFDHYYIYNHENVKGLELVLIAEDEVRRR
jgi:hypothetical protein